MNPSFENGTVCFWCLCEANAGGEALHGKFLEDCDRHKTPEAVGREVFGLRTEDGGRWTEDGKSFAGAPSSGPTACAGAAGLEASGSVASFTGWVRRLIAIADLFANSVRAFPCGHKPNGVGGKCDACEALKEWETLKNFPIGTPIGGGRVDQQAGIANDFPNATLGADNRSGRNGAAAIRAEAETAGETAAEAFKGGSLDAMDQAAVPTDPGDHRCVAETREPFSAAAGGAEGGGRRTEGGRRSAEGGGPRP